MIKRKILLDKVVRLDKLKLYKILEDSKLEKNSIALRLIHKFKGRIPAEQMIEFIISFAYVYGNNNDIRGGNDTEFLLVAEENMNRMPESLKLDLKFLFDELSIKEIASLIYELLIKRERFVDNSNETIVELAYKMLNIENNDSVFDLGSGLGTFLAGVYQRSIQDKLSIKSISGIDINYKLQALSAMALELIVDSNTNVKYSINYANIFTDENNYEYNKGFVFAPLGLRLMVNESTFRTISKNVFLTARNSTEWLFIDRLLKNLKGTKKRAFAIVSGRALFNAADKEYREYLLKQGMIEGIIELPNNLLEDTAIKLFALVFSENNRSVKLFDATKFVVTERNQKVSKLDINSLVAFYNSNEISTRTVEEIIELQNWIPSTALLNIEKPNNGRKLKDVSVVFTGSQYTLRNFVDKVSEKKTDYKLLASSDIQNGLVDFDKLTYIFNDDSKLDKYAIKQNDVIITSKSSKIKIAVIDFEPDCLTIVTGGMIVVRPITSQLNPTFLKIYFESEQGQKLLKSIQKGMTIITLNSNELGELTIPVPPFDYQMKIAQKYNNKLSTLWALKSEMLKIENELANFYYSFEDEVI